MRLLGPEGTLLRWSATAQGSGIRGGAALGKLGLEDSMVRWAWSHLPLLLDKPAKAQKVSQGSLAKAVKRDGEPPALHRPPCPTHVFLKAAPSQALVMFLGHGPLPLPAGEVPELQVDNLGVSNWRKGRHVVKRNCSGGAGPGQPPHEWSMCRDC